MRIASAIHASLLLVLVVGFFVAEAARHRITVRSFRTNYRIDWWDDGRDRPYRIIYKKNGLRSDYTFDESGHLKTLRVGRTTYTFDSANQAANGSAEIQSSSVGSRMLLSAEEYEALEDVHSVRRRLYDCTDCENTWDTLCGVGIVDVCNLVPLLPSNFNDDAQSSLTIMCGALGAACETPAFDTCEGRCIAGELHILSGPRRDNICWYEVEERIQLVRRKPYVAVGFFTRYACE